MKIFGIVAEYNPLHQNHIFHLQKTKELCGDGFIACVISGNFCQRGEPSVLDKHIRAKHAILAGADIVLELPTIFAIGSAENFAYGAINILKSIKADAICCGSESGDCEKLKFLADACTEKPYFDAAKKYLDLGMSYASSLGLAEKELFGSDLLEKPNNLLAIEYLKAIKQLDYNLDFYTIKRTDDYACDDILKSKSASAIRTSFYQNNLEKAKDAIPPFVYQDLEKSDITLLIRYRQFLPLFLATQTKTQLQNIEGMTEGLENRIESSICCDFEKFINTVKTKRYTRTKLNRLFLNCLLGITKQDAIDAYNLSPKPKILALKKDSTILSELNKRCIKLTDNTDDIDKIDIITQKADHFYYTISNIVVNKNEINCIQKV